MYPAPVAKKRIAFEPAKYNALLGTDVSSKDMLEYFTRLEVEYDEKNNELYRKYKNLADKQNKVIFGGRLGEYKYYDMDKVIAAALEQLDRIV